MALSIYLLGWNRITTPSILEGRSYRYKKRLFFITLLSILGAMYFFARHNNYCEPLSNLIVNSTNYFALIFFIYFHFSVYVVRR